MTYGSGSRNGVDPLWVTIHTGEGARRAADLAAFFDDNPGASANAAFDAFTILDMIDSSRYAWTLGSGNMLSINGEACAFAMMTREQWLSPTTITFWHPELKRNVTVDNPRDLVRRMAEWARRECERWNIPKRVLTVEQCAAGWAGIIDHRTYNRAYNAGNHWDVGDGFPRDVFLADVLGESPESGSDNVNNLQATIPVHVEGEDPWTDLAVPHVGGSLSVPANGEAWLLLHTANTPSTVEVWLSVDGTLADPEAGHGVKWETVVVKPDAYVARRLPVGTHGVSFVHVEGVRPVAVTVELYRP